MILFFCLAASLESYGANSENFKKSLLISQAVTSTLASKKAAVDSSDFTVWLQPGLGSTDWTVTFYGQAYDGTYVNQTFTISAGSSDAIVGKVPYGNYTITVNCENYNGDTEVDLSAYGYNNYLYSSDLYFFNYGSPNKSFTNVDVGSPYGIHLDFRVY